MKYFSVILSMITLLLTGACRDHQPPVESPVADTPKKDSVTNKFFPVAEWLKGEIAYVDSTPLAIYKYTTENNRKDSAFIKAQEFDQLAAAFLPPGLAPDSMQQYFSENAFDDKTTGYLTFTYSTRNKQLPLQRVDVLSAPQGNTQTVKSVFLQSTYQSGDTVITKKMFWNARHDLLIITSLQRPGKAPLLRQLKVVWNTDPAE